MNADLYPLNEFTLLIVYLTGPLDQFDVPQDSRQWRAQIMRNRGYELGLYSIQLFQVRDIVQHHRLANALNRRSLGTEDAAIGRFNFLAAHRRTT